MANIKISELNPLLTVQDADVLPIVDNAITKKVTAAILRSYTEGNSVLLTGAQTVAGIKTFTSQLASSVATGTAPFSVASTTKVTNLNADLLDGLSSADFQGALTLTTTGSSGASTLASNTLNVPNYTLAGLGGVPYTGATTNVDLGTHSLTASDLVINHASGSGVAASITKGGAGEALTVVKSSGSGNAASITGGTTLISELNLTTDLADAYIASAATWNAKQNAITLTTTGTSGAATLVGATLNIPNYGTALANYLPLAGGTLTGNLIGTTAQFNKIGIGNAASVTSFIFSNVNPTGGTSISAWRGIFSASNDVTSRLNGVNIAVGTQASTTISDITAYNAEGTSFGAGSSATRVTGFSADSTLANALATNVYGFQGSIALGTNRWNLYMIGTAANYMNGSLLIGTTTDAGFKLDVNGTARISGALTGSSTAQFTKLSLGTSSFSGAVGITNLRLNTSITGAAIFVNQYNDSTIQSDVTSVVQMHRAEPSTAASAFTLSSLINYQSAFGTKGVGSTITDFVGFNASDYSVATNTFGFRGNIVSGTNKWNLFMSGTAANHLQGNLLIGGTNLPLNRKISIEGNITGGVTSYGIDQFVTISSDVTTSMFGYRSNPTTAAAAFTLPDLYHFYANDAGIGAGSSVTRQYGFFGNIASGTGKWNLYSSGTAANYMNGNLGIGTATPASKLDVQVSTAGTSIIGYFNNNDFTAANKSAIRVRQQTGASTGFSAYLGMDGNTLFLSNDTTATNHLAISTTGAATFSGILKAEGSTSTFKVFQTGATALKTYTKLAEAQIVSYQSTAGSPFTKTTDIVANADSGVASQMRLLTTTSAGTPTTALLLSDTGAATFSAGISLSGATAPASGIQFPATQVASANNNNLDDYEEGTWTMGVSFGGASVGVTYGANTGSYTKVGRQVTVTGYCLLTNKGTSVGNAKLTGLPFTTSASSQQYSTVSLFLTNVTFTGQYASYSETNATTMDLNQISNLGVATTITNTNFANNTGFILSLTYFV